MYEILILTPAIVKPATLETTLPIVVGSAYSEFTATDDREYDTWLDAHADDLAAEVEAYALYEYGLPTW